MPDDSDQELTQGFRPMGRVNEYLMAAEGAFEELVTSFSREGTLKFEGFLDEDEIAYYVDLSRRIEEVLPADIPEEADRKRITLLRVPSGIQLGMRRLQTVYRFSAKLASQTADVGSLMRSVGRKWNRMAKADNGHSEAATFLTGYEPTQVIVNAITASPGRPTEIWDDQPDRAVGAVARISLADTDVEPAGTLTYAVASDLATTLGIELPRRAVTYRNQQYSLEFLCCPTDLQA